MTKKICRICLRTDLETRDISDTLFDFHDEITEYGIYENSALKYCSVCEHQLLKFYKFSWRCRQANTILKTVKREKNGRLPTNLHKLLPPPSLGFNDRSSLKLFSLKNGQLEPILDTIKVESNEINSSQLETNIQTIKVENDFEADSEATDALQTVDEVQYNFVKADELGNSYVARVYNVSEIMNNLDTNSYAEPENVFMEEHTETKHSLSNSEENDELGKKQVKLEDNSSDSDDLNKDSDTDMIKEFKQQILSTKESKLKCKGERRDRKKQHERQPLKNLKDLEKIFDIQVFASEEEAKQEMESRKTSEPYLSSDHKCEICYTVYKYSKLLEYHKRCHSPASGEHVCSICSMRFPTKRATTKHKYSAHYGKFKCKRCPLITYQRVVLQSHYQHHAGVIYSCQQCDRTFTHTSTFKTHMRLRHKTEHVCVTCARTFVSERGLMAHRNMIHHTKSKVDNDAKVHCEPCDLTFADEDVYTLHIMNTETHTDLAQDIIACKTCGARFEDTNGMRQHRQLLHPPHLHSRTDRVWTNGKPMDKCPKCGMTGFGFAWLYHHFRSEHADASYDAELAHRRVHMCDTCGKCYTTMHALRDHINTHTDTKPYACAVCPARFTSRSKLQNHSEFHEPAKRECPQCGKKFVSASNLSNHMRFHTQDRRYKCSLCHKGFLHAATLREHVRGVHLNVRRVRKILKRETQTKAVDQ